MSHKPPNFASIPRDALFAIYGFVKSRPEFVPARDDLSAFLDDGAKRGLFECHLNLGDIFAMLTNEQMLATIEAQIAKTRLREPVTIDALYQTLSTLCESLQPGMVLPTSAMDLRAKLTDEGTVSRVESMVAYTATGLPMTVWKPTLATALRVREVHDVVSSVQDRGVESDARDLFEHATTALRKVSSYPDGERVREWPMHPYFAGSEVNAHLLLDAVCTVDTDALRALLAKASA